MNTVMNPSFSIDLQGTSADELAAIRRKAAPPLAHQLLEAALRGDVLPGRSRAMPVELGPGGTRLCPLSKGDAVRVMDGSRHTLFYAYRGLRNSIHPFRAAVATRAVIVDTSSGWQPDRPSTGIDAGADCAHRIAGDRTSAVLAI